MVHKLIKVCLVSSICPSWERRLNLISAVNTLPPRLHEVTGPWLSSERRGGEQRREGPWKGALCWFRRARGFSLSEVVVLGQQPGLQTLSLAGTELPSGVTGPSWTAPWAAQSQAWAELVGLGWDTPQRAAKINHWCFAEIPWLRSLNSEDHSHGRGAEWPHTEQQSTGQNFFLCVDL